VGGVLQPVHIKTERNEKEFEVHNDRNRNGAMAPEFSIGTK
jgi:hypothetical protein